MATRLMLWRRYPSFQGDVIPDRSFETNQAAPGGYGHGFGSVMSVEFVQDALYVTLRGLIGDGERRGDLFVLEALRHQPENIHLAWSQWRMPHALGQFPAHGLRNGPRARGDIPNRAHELVGQHIFQQIRDRAGFERPVNIFVALIG